MRVSSSLAGDRRDLDVQQLAAGVADRHALHEPDLVFLLALLDQESRGAEQPLEVPGDDLDPDVGPYFTTRRATLPADARQLAFEVADPGLLRVAPDDVEQRPVADRQVPAASSVCRSRDPLCRTPASRGPGRGVGPGNNTSEPGLMPLSSIWRGSRYRRAIATFSCSVYPDSSMISSRSWSGSGMPCRVFAVQMKVTFDRS